jgi:hypothetical protein
LGENLNDLKAVGALAANAALLLAVADALRVGAIRGLPLYADF